MSIGFMVLIFIVFYFLLIRPQVKRQKEHKTMVDALNKGDEVVTAGGIVGKITDIADQYITSRWPRSMASRCSSRCSAPPYRPCCPRARSSRSEVPRPLEAQ